MAFGQLRQKSPKLHHLDFKFWSKTFTVDLQHITIIFVNKGFFQSYLHLGSCTEVSHFNRMDLQCCFHHMAPLILLPVLRKYEKIIVVCHNKTLSKEEWKCILKLPSIQGKNVYKYLVSGIKYLQISFQIWLIVIHLRSIHWFQEFWQ